MAATPRGLIYRMAKRPIVILHGWSDSAKSFQALARHIARELATTVKSIDLGEYESMNDAVTFDDIDAAMDAAWDDHGLPRTPRSVDVVVHSTGGLVIRNWMTRHFSATETPVYRLVMLAPRELALGS